jgi:UDP-glucose 4-epimerase
VRALVTGGAGFIGSHVTGLLLQRGATVTVLDNFATGRRDNLAALDGDLAVEEADLAYDDVTGLLEDRRFDLIIHAAGSASIPFSIENPRADLEANVLTTQNLLEKVRRVSPASRVVNLSSATVYAEGGDSAMSEDYPKNPASPYGIDKLAAEMYATLYAGLHGLHVATVRIFSVFGPRLRKQVVWDFMKRLSDHPDELVIHADGSERRDPNHVANVAEAILVVANKARMNGDVYNVASRNFVSIDQLARDVAAAMGCDPVIRHSGKRGAGHPRMWSGDISRLESLGYAPVIGYHEGLADTVRWFRSIST